MKTINPKYGLGKFLLVQTFTMVVSVSLISVALVSFILIQTLQQVRQNEIDRSIETMKRGVSIQLQYFDFSTLEYTLQKMNQAIGFHRIEAYDKYGTLRAEEGKEVGILDEGNSVSLYEDGNELIGTLLIWGEPTINLTNNLMAPLLVGLLAPIILFIGSGVLFHRSIRAKVILPLQNMRELIRVSQTHGTHRSQNVFQFRELSEIYAAFQKAWHDQEHEAEAKVLEMTKRLSQTRVLKHALSNAGVAVSYVVSSGEMELQTLGAVLPPEIREAFTQNDFSEENLLKILRDKNCTINEITSTKHEENDQEVSPYTIQVHLHDEACWRVSLVTIEDNGVALLAIDVSELYAAQNELFFKQRMDALGALTSGVAHDFNNILAIILAGLENIKAEDDPKTQNNLKPVWNAALRGRGLVRQLLTFARRAPRKPEVLDPNAVINNFVEIMPAVFGQNIRLNVESLTEKFVKCDRNLLETALTNFLVNARDAMPNGGTVTIGIRDITELERHKLKLKNDVNYVDFYVEDQGSGIPEEIGRKIFDPFFSTKPSGQGTGLGLSLVYNFAVASGGHLYYANLEKGGTCFHLILPEGTVKAKAVSKSKSNQLISVSREQVLYVIDDEESLVRIIKIYFEKLGYIVRPFCEVRTFIDQVENVKDADIVLSDIHLQDGSGLEIAEELRENSINCQLFLMSGNMHEELLASAKLLNAEVIEKPFELTELSEKLCQPNQILKKVV